MVSTFLAASKSTPLMYHGLAMPKAASKSWFCTHTLPAKTLPAPQHGKTPLGPQGRFAPLRGGLRPSLTTERRLGLGKAGRDGLPTVLQVVFLCLSRFFPSDFAWAPRLIFQAQATSKGGYQDSGPLSKNASAGFLLPRPCAVELACSRSGHRKPLARYGAMEGALRSRLATPGASNLEAD